MANPVFYVTGVFKKKSTFVYNRLRACASIITNPIFEAAFIAVLRGNETKVCFAKFNLVRHLRREFNTNSELTMSEELLFAQRLLKKTCIKIFQIEV